MFTKFKFSNFLSFKDEAILSLCASSLDDGHNDALFQLNKDNLLKTLAIYGPNASGKTTTLKALGVFINWILNGAELNLRQPNGSFPFILNPETKNLPSNFEMEFSINGKKYLYGYSAFQNKINQEWLISGKKILFKREQQTFIELNEKYEDILKRSLFPSENLLFLTSIITKTEEDSLTNEIKNILKAVKVGPATSEYIGRSLELFQDQRYTKIMRKIVCDSSLGIKDILVTENEMTVQEALKTMPAELIGLFFQGKNSIPTKQANMIYEQFDNAHKSSGVVSLDLSTQSEGTKNIFALSGPIAEALYHGQTLVLDELDSSLHPLICRYLLKIFENKEENPNNARLIFTTHDISLLDKEFFRRDQIRFTEKDIYGVSKIFSLADIENRKEVSFSKRYLEGRYGAIPYLKSLEDIERYE